MPDLNENMDEMMRKAARDYPLQVSGQNWEKIAAEINPRHKKRPWLWIFLPLLLGASLIYILPKIPGSPKKNAATASAHTAAKGLNTSTITTPPQGIANNHQPAPVNNTLPFTGNIAITNARDHIAIEKGKSNFAFENPSFAINDIDRAEKGSPAGLGIELSSPGIVAENKSEPAAEGVPEDGEDAHGGKVPGKEPAPVANTGNNEAVQPSVEKEKDKKKKRGHFYAGLSGGLDVSSVKLQGFDKTGHNLGFIAGINLNRHWAIETGIAINRKYYSTDGKYFKGEYPLPYYAIIESATGDCDMYDIPLTVRYTINPGSKWTYTVNAGVSSYLMQEESYTYHVNHNGNRYPRMMEYSDPEFTPFAVFTAGAGIGLNLGKMKLGAEPYFRLPLQKMGTGKLPLQSAGLNLRITRAF